jgi:Flp pilus assembly pilin Flp
MPVRRCGLGRGPKKILKKIRLPDDMGNMVSWARSFLHDEHGQDLVEYALLVAFVALASAALFLGDGPSVSGKR